jgi:hypothetical protein
MRLFVIGIGTVISFVFLFAVIFAARQAEKEPSAQAAQTQKLDVDASCRDGRLTAQLQQARSIRECHPVLGTREQTSIGGYVGIVELQLETPVEIEPKSARFRFTRWVRHDRPRSDDIRC